WQELSMTALTVAIVIENFATAIGTVIFVAYLSALCRNPLHTATQYALLTALASTGRTFFAAGTGFAAKALGWPAFFVACVLTALPALALLVWLQKRGHFRALEEPQANASYVKELLGAGGNLVGGGRLQLAVVLDADRLQQIELRLQEVDVAFLVL